MNTLLTIEPELAPLTTTEDGSVRVAGTRVGLETVVGQFNRGCSAEEIAAKFPTIGLRNAYAVIAYYLAHRAAVDDYIEFIERDAVDARKEAEPLRLAAEVRERLSAVFHARRNGQPG
jgi:uncharacterized protein (DUF433 family)